MAQRLSQVYIEVIRQGSPNARLTQQYIEVIRSSPGNARETQCYIEAIVPFVAKRKKSTVFFINT